MHRPTYFAIMSLAGIYGIYNAVTLFYTNWLLFSASVIVILITAIGAFLQFMDVDDIEFKWMLGYVFPIALLALGSVVGYTEVTDALLIQAGMTPAPHVIQGKSSDYSRAAVMQWVAMIYPLGAIVIAKLVQAFVDCSKKP